MAGLTSCTRTATVATGSVICGVVNASARGYASAPLPTAQCDARTNGTQLPPPVSTSTPDGVTVLVPNNTDTTACTSHMANEPGRRYATHALASVRPVAHDVLRMSRPTYESETLGEPPAATVADVNDCPRTRTVQTRPTPDPATVAHCIRRCDCTTHPAVASNNDGNEGGPYATCSR